MLEIGALQTRCFWNCDLPAAWKCSLFVSQLFSKRLCLLGMHCKGKDDYEPRSKEADNGTS